MSHSYRKQYCAGSRRHRTAGFSLVELLVAITIGAVLIFGATQVYVDSRNTYATNESVARLQETARFALSVIEPDVRMSNYWGLLKGANLVAGQTKQTAAANAIAGTAATQCGNNFAVDLSTTLQASNNSYSFGCAAYTSGGVGAVLSADTLTVRRVSTSPSIIPKTDTTVLRVCSSRIGGVLVKDASACTDPPAGQVNDLVVHAYYVDRNAEGQAGVPALRRWALTDKAEFQDDEIVAGVEDMQIQFGIDPTGTSGVATQYVNAVGPATLPATSQIVAVRIWLLVRSETTEVGFKDTRVYEYGDRLATTGTTNNLSSGTAARKAYKPNDSYRRLLVSRTIMIRNSLGT